jgi:MFS superfamily sulfate permease-like transporter
MDSFKFTINNLKSGITVFLVALPLCLGIALACNAPLFSGIIAGVVAGILVTIFSGSRLSVSGPAAGLTAVVLTSVATLGSFNAFCAAIVLVGLLQIVLGLLKTGAIANYIPNAVIKGMLAGIGVILILKQIPHLVGYDKDPEGDFEFFQPDGHNSFSELIYMINNISIGAVIIGILALVFLVFADKKWYKENVILSKIPAPLVVVVMGIVLNAIFKSSGKAILGIDPEHLVSVPHINNIQELKSNLIFPDFSLITSLKFWLVVFTLAIVASLETLLSIEAVDRIDPEKQISNKNKELVAQGIGNLTCGLIGGLPVTSVIVRSSANVTGGATNKSSAIIHAVLLALCVFLIPTILMKIPNACLAAILIMTGYKLVKPSIFRDTYKLGWGQIIPFVVTIVVMLISDLLIGVAVGILVSTIFITYSNIILSFESSEQLIEDKQYYLLKLPQHVTFFNKGFLQNYFLKLKSDSYVIIDGTIVKSIDADAKEIINEFVAHSSIKKITVEIKELNHLLFN